MFAFGKPPMTCQTWLESLTRRLAWTFPEAQAKDILADYREQLEVGKERGKSDREIIEALGTPAEAVAQLLEEDPSARMELLKHCLLWGALLAVCWAFVWFNFLGSMGTSFWGVVFVVCVFLPISAAVLFMLVRGPARAALEQAAAFEKTVSPVAVYCLPAGIMTAATAIQEILILSALRLKVILPENIGFYTAISLQLLALAMALLAAWLLLRSVTRSILYFPGIVHAGGAAFSALAMLAYYTAMDVSTDRGLPPEFQILIRLAPYVVGLVTARAFQHWVDGSSPLPYCFRAGNVTWPDWRHRLGVSLAGWFSTEQTIEILEDYQEQLELGLEQGRTEANILTEMGRPATVVRDLLAEDRKARTRRRKTRIWSVLAFLAGWLLLGLARAFEFGHGFYFQHAVQIGVIAVALGAASLFALLRTRERAAVEQRFPAEKRPTVWVFLLPLVIFAVLNGFMIYLCAFPWVFQRNLLFYIIVIGIESSVLLLCLLMIWTLSRCFSGSIRYFPAAIHAAGCAASVLCTGIFCHGIDIEGSFGRSLYLWFLPNLLPYAVSVVLAAGIWLAIRTAGKPRKEG